MNRISRGFVYGFVLAVGAQNLAWAEPTPAGMDVPGSAQGTSVGEVQSPTGAGNSRLMTWMKENVSISGGVKIWVAKWQVPGQAGGTTFQTTSDLGPMVGPTVTLSAKMRDSEWLSSAFTNFTWLQSGFDLDPIRLSDATAGTIVDSTATAKRRDYTLSVGTTIWKSLGVFAGYYNTQQRFSFSGRSVLPVPGVAVTSNPDFRIRGPILGVFGSSSLSERVGVYGNTAIGFLKYQTAGFNAPGAQAWSTELGLNIAGPELWKVGTTFQMGFRAQVITINTPNPLTVSGDQHRNDISWGPTFSVLATF